jgi:16S rRNA (uracil1498-N3)-methyltransferase
VTIPRFMVRSEALTGTSTMLTGPELHHLRVRRLRVGSELVLSNGLGRERRGVVVALNRRQALIRLAADAPSQPSSPIRLILAQALLKADKLDLVIEKTTELGVDEVLIYNSDRTVGRASAERRARWERIARSAAKQSQRSTVPLIEGPISFGGLLSRHAGARRLFFWEEGPVGGWAAAARTFAEPHTVVAVVGPEGGFTAREAERAAGAGFCLIGLAPRILRAETAAIAAVTLCQFLWGDLAPKPDTSQT